mgnify:CR=1 FL=1
MDKDRYFSLRLVQATLQFIGYCFIIFGIITPLSIRPWLIATFPMQSDTINILPAALNSLILFAILFVFSGIMLIASGQKIKVMIDTEENTRITTYHLVEIHALLSMIKDKIK